MLFVVRILTSILLFGECKSKLACPRASLASQNIGSRSSELFHSGLFIKCFILAFLNQISSSLKRQWFFRTLRQTDEDSPFIPQPDQSLWLRAVAESFAHSGHSHVPCEKLRTPTTSSR